MFSTAIVAQHCSVRLVRHVVQGRSLKVACAPGWQMHAPVGVSAAATQAAGVGSVVGQHDHGRDFQHCPCRKCRCSLLPVECSCPVGAASMKRQWKNSGVMFLVIHGMMHVRAEASRHPGRCCWRRGLRMASICITGWFVFTGWCCA